MPLHLIKLCVGTDSIEDLEDWIKLKLAEQKKRGVKKPERIHTTRMVPKRAEEIIGGGSIYWVIRGEILCRERILDIRPFVDKDGVGRCRLVLDPKCVPVRPRPYRAFQGWRYLADKDAPPRSRPRRARRVRTCPSRCGANCANWVCSKPRCCRSAGCGRVFAATSSRTGPSGNAMRSAPASRHGALRDSPRAKPARSICARAFGQRSSAIDWPALSSRSAFRQHAIERRRGRALVRREVDVARRHREAVLFAHASAAPMIFAGMSRSRAMRGHDLELLVVLLAEHREVGRDLQETAWPPRCDAAEEMRAELVLQPGERRAPGTIVVAKPSGYIVATLRRPDRDRPSAAPAPRHRRPRCADRCEKSSFGRELRRIDEDRHHDAVGAAPREAHQRQVARMQRAHGRHQRDRLALAASARDPSARSGGNVARMRPAVPCTVLGRADFGLSDMVQVNR